MKDDRPNLSRRALLKGALSIAGAAAGARILGPFVPKAHAAGDTPHFVHLFFNAGLNALFSGCADKFLTSGAFDVTNSNVKNVGNGVFTDAATFGTLPAYALQHWGAVGLRHGQALHTTKSNLNSGGEHAILTDGASCYLTELAYLMGGDSPFKAIWMGVRPPGQQEQPAFQGVPIERLSNLSDAIKTLGTEARSTAAPDRASAAEVLETARAESKRQFIENPSRLLSLAGAYDSSIAALRKPPPAEVKFSEISAAYGLGSDMSVSTYASMLAGAELMIRGAGTNVIHINGLSGTWDFHQATNGKSLNGTLSRNKLLGSGGRENWVTPIRIFLDRMLNAPGRNVVVAISGELVRLPNGDHGNGTVAALFGKNVKQGVSYPVDSNARFAADTPGVRPFWAAVAAALGLPGTPFGANPHTNIIA